MSSYDFDDLLDSPMQSPWPQYNDDDFELVGTLENDVKDVDWEALSRRQDEEKDSYETLNLVIPMDDSYGHQESNQENEEPKVYTDLDHRPPQKMTSRDQAGPFTIQEMPEDYQMPPQMSPMTNDYFSEAPKESKSQFTDLQPSGTYQMLSQPAPVAVSDPFDQCFPDYQNTMTGSSKTPATHQMPAAPSTSMVPNQYMMTPQDVPGPSYQLAVYDQKPIASESISAPVAAPVAPTPYHFPAPSWFSQPPNTGSPQDPIHISLLNAPIWQYVDACVNEMMVTNDGRGIFPRLELKIGNLDPMAEYHVGVRLELFNDIKYGYDAKKCQWVEVNRRKNEELPEPVTNEVFSEIQTGKEIMEKGLKMRPVSIYTIGNEKRKRSSVLKARSEEKVKKLEKKQERIVRTMIRVYSQHKYIPVITVYRQASSGEFEPAATSQFPETTFITTTAIKNNSLRLWKRANNQFARDDYKARAY